MLRAVSVAFLSFHLFVFAKVSSLGLKGNIFFSDFHSMVPICGTVNIWHTSDWICSILHFHIKVHQETIGCKTLLQGTKHMHTIMEDMERECRKQRDSLLLCGKECPYIVIVSVGEHTHLPPHPASL